MSLILRSTAYLASALSSIKDFKSSSTSFFLCFNLFENGAFVISLRFNVTIYEFLKV